MTKNGWELAATIAYPDSSLDREREEEA